MKTISPPPQYQGTGTINMRVLRLDDSDTKEISVEDIRRSRKQAADTTPINEFVSELFENMYDGVLITDFNGQILYCNERISEFTSVPQETLVEINILEIISGADRELLNAIVEKALDDERIKLDAECRTQNLGRFPAEISVALCHLTAEGQLCFFIRNIWKRMQVEEALRDSERRCGDILESMCSWIWEVDTSGVYMYCSEPVQDYLPHSSDDLIGWSIFDFVEENCRVQKVKQFKEIVANCEPMEDFDLLMLTNDGEVSTIIYRGIPILDENGTLHGYQGVAYEA